MSLNQPKLVEEPMGLGTISSHSLIYGDRIVSSSDAPEGAIAGALIGGTAAVLTGGASLVVGGLGGSAVGAYSGA